MRPGRRRRQIADKYKPLDQGNSRVFTRIRDLLEKIKATRVGVFLQGGLYGVTVRIESRMLDCWWRDLQQVEGRMSKEAGKT